MATAARLYDYADRHLAPLDCRIQVSVHGCHEGTLEVYQRLQGPPQTSGYTEPVYPTRLLLSISTRTSSWGGGDHSISARDLGCVVRAAVAESRS